MYTTNIRYAIIEQDARRQCLYTLETKKESQGLPAIQQPRSSTKSDREYNSLFFLVESQTEMRECFPVGGIYILDYSRFPSLFLG